MMRVLLNHSTAKKLYVQHPDYVGVLFSPNRTRYYQKIPFAIDNGAYGAWLKGEDFDENLFVNVCQKFANKSPLFVVCPDKIGDKEETLRLWEKWHGFLQQLCLKSAFVFTDGMSPEDIPIDADYVFIGGSTTHLERAIPQIPRIKQPVHVGRVNHHIRLWKAHNWGATSCDGTGWFRGDKRQKQVLIDYLNIKSANQQQESNTLFHVGAYCL